jgi:AraC family transcriptional activator of tynA and feaB
LGATVAEHARPSKIESFSTDALLHSGRARAWNEIYSAHLAPAEITPSHGDFSAGFALGGLGQLDMVRLITGPCTVHRTANHIEDGRAERIYSFMILLNGEAHFSQGENEVLLRRGDVSFCDIGIPHSNILQGGGEMLLVRVPDDLIQNYLPFPETIRGRALSAQKGVGSIATSLACSLWKQVERGIHSAHADALAHQLLDLFITSYSQAYGTEMSGPFPDAPVHARAVDFIEEMIRDPALNVRRTAAATGISIGQLLAMFIRRGDSFGGFVSRRRLDRAARQLRNPRWRGSTISEIAYSVGYNSVPLFTRTFHSRFGVSPGDYRRAEFN